MQPKNVTGPGYSSGAKNSKLVLSFLTRVFWFFFGVYFLASGFCLFLWVSTQSEDFSSCHFFPLGGTTFGSYFDVLWSIPLGVILIFTAINYCPQPKIENQDRVLSPRNWRENWQRTLVIVLLGMAVAIISFYFAK